MTAQQQLVELNTRECANLDESQGLRIDRAIWLAKHGTAIAELIESFAEEEQARAAIHAYEFDELARPDGYDEGHALSLSETLAAALRKRAAALRKLTHD